MTNRNVGIFWFVATLAAFGILASPLLAKGSPSIHPTVEVEQGSITGREDGAVMAFLGIPYAAPPIGKNRWRAPHPATHRATPLDATHYGASCIQQVLPSGRPPWTSEYMVQGAVSEDCLTLNVWTPATAGVKRPVLVWIHGGGFNEGSGAVPIYRGAALAGRGIVVVTINYRLGLYGFLAHPDLTREAGGTAATNFGLLDQVAALQWIQKNIAQFGGDPAQITIAGQSAGSMAVHSLVASPMAKGLFARGVAQSGLPTIMPMPTLAQSEQTGLALAKEKHVTTIAELRRLTPAQLALPTATMTGPGLRFGPSVDGKFLPLNPAEMVARGNFNDVPMMIGQTSDEGSAFPGYGSGDAAAYQAFMTRSFGDKASEFSKLYPATTDSERSQAVKAASRDRGLAMIAEWSRSRLARGRAPVWGYFFAHPEPGPDSDKFGAFHSSEIPYAFGTLDMAPNRNFTLADRQLSLVMSSYWVNFVKSGNPNGDGLLAWKPMMIEGPTVVEFGTGRVAERPLLTPDKARIYRDFVAAGGQLSMF